VRFAEQVTCDRRVANVVVNLSASNETVARRSGGRDLVVQVQSDDGVRVRLRCRRGAESRRAISVFGPAIRIDR